jgi:hypothetical protein
MKMTEEQKVLAKDAILRSEYFDKLMDDCARAKNDFETEKEPQKRTEALMRWKAALAKARIVRDGLAEELRRYDTTGRI